MTTTTSSTALNSIKVQPTEEQKKQAEQNAIKAEYSAKNGELRFAELLSIRLVHSNRFEQRNALDLAFNIKNN